MHTAHVICDLHEGTGGRAQGGAYVHHGVMGGERCEFIGCGKEWPARLLRDFAGRHFSKTRICVEPGANGGSADRECIHARQTCVNCLQSLIELRAHPEITWPSVNGVASMRCVRGTIITPKNWRDFAFCVLRSARIAGARAFSSSSTVATCIAVGNASLDEWA